LPELNWPGFVNGELFNTGTATEAVCEPVGQPYPVIVLALFGAQFLPDKLAVGVARAVDVGIVAGVPQGQDPGLVKRNVTQSLAFGRELELFFLFLALFFGDW
jgi:hypothetical protein